MSGLPHDPHRSVNWVWERALEIKEGGSPFHKRMDGTWVGKSVKFLDRLRRAPTAWDRKVLSFDMPDLFYAHAFWERLKTDPMSWELEARILARETNEQIAPRFGTVPSVIEYYEKIFFNVRDRFDADRYILHQAIGPEVAKGLKLTDQRLILKLFGWKGGPYVLDELVGMCPRTAHPTNSTAVGDFFDADMKLVLRMKSALVARTAPVNFMAPYDVMDRYHKVLEMERANGGGAGAASSVMYNLEAMFTSLGSAFKVIDPQDKDHCKLLPESGVGMSLEERRETITTGKVPDSVQQDVASLSTALKMFRNGNDNS